jgi:phenylalanyl-tRNA synthetase beta chain
VDFYDIKGMMEGFLLHSARGRCTRFRRTRGRSRGRQAADILANGECIGWLGAVRANCWRSTKSRPRFYGKSPPGRDRAPRPVGIYRPLPKFPPVFRDLACVFPAGVPVGDVLALVRESASEIEEAVVFDVFTGEKIGKGLKSVGIRMKLQPSDKTLTDADVHSIHTKVVDLLENRFGGRIRTA